jgi:hypothetical protein
LLCTWAEPSSSDLLKAVSPLGTITASMANLKKTNTILAH